MPVKVSVSGSHLAQRTALCSGLIPPLSLITPEKLVLACFCQSSRVAPEKDHTAPLNEPSVTPIERVLLMSNSPLPVSVILAVPPLDLLVKMIAPPSDPPCPAVGGDIGRRRGGDVIEG